MYFLNKFIFYLRSKDLIQRNLKFIQILFKNALLSYRKLPEYSLQNKWVKAVLLNTGSLFWEW